MSRDNVRTEIAEILKDKTTTADEQIATLKKLRTEIRASQTTGATEPDLKQQLNDVDEALKSIEATDS